MPLLFEYGINRFLHDVAQIRAVAGQHSLPESCLANKTKMYLMQKKLNSKSQEREYRSY